MPTRIETTDQLAATIAQLEFYGLDERDVNDYYAKLDAMTLADAQQHNQAHFPLENLVFVLIGNPGEIQNIAKKYAPKLDTNRSPSRGFKYASARVRLRTSSEESFTEFR